MARQNYLADAPWDEMHEDLRMRTRIFDRRVDDMLSASLHELLPGSPGFTLHMHYGAEEMFFVVAGTPTLRTGHGEERLVRGMWCIARKGVKAYIRSRTRRMNRSESSLYQRAASRTLLHTPSRESPGSRPVTPTSRRRSAEILESSPASNCQQKSEDPRLGAAMRSPRRARSPRHMPTVAVVLPVACSSHCRRRYKRGSPHESGRGARFSGSPGQLS